MMYVLEAILMQGEMILPRGDCQIGPSLSGKLHFRPGEEMGMFRTHFSVFYLSAIEFIQLVRDAFKRFHPHLMDTNENCRSKPHSQTNASKFFMTWQWMSHTWD